MTAGTKQVGRALSKSLIISGIGDPDKTRQIPSSEHGLMVLLVLRLYGRQGYRPLSFWLSNTIGISAAPGHMSCLYHNKSTLSAYLKPFYRNLQLRYPEYIPIL
jgi:hypothetical protein